MSTGTLGAVIVHQTDAEYHADRARVSRSQLVDFMGSPRTFKRRHRDRAPSWQKKPTKAMDFGTSCHTAIFVDRDATKAFAIIPDDVLNNDGHKKGGAWLKWKRENPDKHHLLASEGESWQEMWESIQENDAASKLLMGRYAGAMEEFTIQWTYEGIDLRCRIDRVIPTWCLVDLKTIQCADEHDIQREMTDRKLFFQAAFYRWAWYLVSGKWLPFVFVFVEKVAPYRTVCRNMPEDWMDDGLEEALDGLRRLQACADEDYWPRHFDNEIRTIERPRYSVKKPEFQESNSL